MFLPATIVVLVVFAVHCIHAATDKDGNCTNIEPILDLNSTQLTGDFYWILTTKPGGSEAEGIKCTKLTVTVDDSGIMTTIRRSIDIVTEKPVIDEIIATPINGVRARLSIQLDSVNYIYTFIATDYTDYVIVFVKSVDDPPIQFVQVTSRKLLNTDIYDEVRSILDVYCMADDLKVVDQVNCTYSQE